jgi:molybdopterin converting factor subunit 1
LNLRVLYFASLVDRTGVSRETVEIDPGGTVQSLWEELVRRHPALGEAPTLRPMVACDMVYSDWDRRLEGVEEVAFLPPVSGG